jgi:hypothetical protein
MCFADCVSYASMEQTLTDYVKEDVLDSYITETELNNKGYLTEHQSLSNYYTKSEINQQLGDINSILESIIGKTMITFTINWTEYQAEEGMVWGTWLNSDLMHPDLDGVTGGTYQDKSGKNLLNADGVLVRNVDLIIEGHEYRLV